MSITAPSQGDPTRLAFALALLAELESLRGEIAQSLGQSGLPNSSFEDDTDNDGIPDAWTFTAYPGGSGTLDGTTAIHGRRAFVITSPGGSGNGGGYLETTDFLPVSPNWRLRLGWEIKSTAAEIQNRVEVRWYAGPDDADYLSTTVLWQEDTNNSLTWRYYYAHAYPPAAARYAKIRLVGGDSSDDTAGNVAWDHLRLDNAGRLPVRERYLVSTAGGTTGTESGIRFQAFPWICPLDVTEIKLRLWAGGALGGSNAAGHTGGGGGGYAESLLPVTPGHTYTLRIGYGGGSFAVNGGHSQFLNGSTVLVKAAGGVNGSSIGGGGGGGTANLGDFCVAGQNGQAITFGGSGGAGGLGGSGGHSPGQAGIFPGGGGGNGGGLGADGMLEIEY